MKPYKYRRIADRLLWQQARKLMRDRGLPLRTRLKARLIAATFRVRLLIGWHSAPTAWMQIKVCRSKSTATTAGQVTTTSLPRPSMLSMRRVGYTTNNILLQLRRPKLRNPRHDCSRKP